MSGHVHLRSFEQHGDRLVLTCPYAVTVVQEAPGIDNRNAFPWSRLFLMDPAGSNGADAVTDLAARRRHPLRPGEVLFLPPDRLYGFRFSPGMRMIACHFRLEWALGCDVFSGRTACEALTGCGDLITRAYAAAAAAESAHGGLGAVAELRGILLQLAGRFIRDVPTIAPRLQAVLAHIAGNSRADLAVDELAAIAGLSREHFSREFRREVGMPPKELLHRRLVQRACSSLLAGERVKDAAEQLGFTSEFYFSRFFKARTGIAPRDFARTAQGG